VEQHQIRAEFISADACEGVPVSKSIALFPNGKSNSSQPFRRPRSDSTWTLLVKETPFYLAE
jgi:hypothetical protein